MPGFDNQGRDTREAGLIGCEAGNVDVGVGNVAQVFGVLEAA